MTPILGKRKRRDQVLSTGADADPRTDAEASQHLRALLQRHFETKFAPLDASHQAVYKRQDVSVQSSNDETESDWTGISEEENEEPAQIVRYQSLQCSRIDVPKEELKMFMSTKPPSTATQSTSTVKRKQPEQVGSEEAATDAENLKKDLALQRLLKESHLLESQSSLSLSGHTRHKALDLRLQGLGSKSSIYTQQKMPLAQRKGIIAKAAEKDDSRRKEAKENGIILEKVVKGKKKLGARRERGVGAPSVGKFQGGMLKLSKKDVADIEGPKRALKVNRRK